MAEFGDGNHNLISLILFVYFWSSFSRIRRAAESIIVKQNHTLQWKTIHVTMCMLDKVIATKMHKLPTQNMQTIRRLIKNDTAVMNVQDGSMSITQLMHLC